MITRLASLLLLIYAIGFVLFSVTLGKPAPDDAAATDAAVAITGGKGRIEHGIEALRKGKAKRLLVAGADPLVTKEDLVERFGQKRLFACCVDLGSESVDTSSNAEEAQRWLDRRGYRSLRLITNDWHMHRAAYEFRTVLGKDYVVVQDAVRTEPRFVSLFAEYNKYIVRRAAAWLAI